MHIKITTRLKPFTNDSGTRCVIPRSAFAIEVFPALIRLYDMRTFSPKIIDEVSFTIRGPVKGFTVQQDLERGLIKVWGDAENGYFRYSVFQDFSDSMINLKLERGSETLQWQQKEDRFRIISLDEKISLPTQETAHERLSFGLHKSQNWCEIYRRQDMKEILPFLFRFSQLTPVTGLMEPLGVAELLQQCAAHIENRDILKVIPSFTALVQSGFRDMFFPTLTDDLHQGYHFKQSPHEGSSPLILMSEIGRLIRQLFIQNDGNRLMPLPLVPPEISCGRLTNIRLEGIGTLDLEWRKRDVRRMILRAQSSKTIHLTLPNGLLRYRFKEKSESKGKILSGDDSIEICQGKEYYFDNFSG